MCLVIVYTNSNGGVSVIIPADCGMSIEEIQAKDVPEGIQSFIVDASTLPEDKTWRDAWVIVNGAIAVDESKKASIILNKFDAEKAIGREAQVFTTSELIRLMPYSYTLNELIRFKNFWGGVANGVPYAGLKQAAQGLVSSGAILQSDYDKLSGILAEQNIILGD